jgi:23S rRNA (pseudouridine1915-N3)-methyltransferase
MHIRLLAVGDRQPGWVDAAFIEYAARLPRQWQFRLHAIAAAQRAKAASGGDARVAEGEKILAKLKPAEFVVVLDEHGTQFSSAELATKIGDWQTVGQDVAFVIGGPDGLSENCLQRGNLRWSLSKLTLPHGLARVLFAEQIYRAWSLNAGHPYHRE